MEGERPAREATEGDMGNPGYAVVAKFQESTYTWATTLVFETPEQALADLAQTCTPAQGASYQFFLVGMTRSEAAHFGDQGLFSFLSWQPVRVEDDLWIAGQDEGTKNDVRISYIED